LGIDSEDYPLSGILADEFSNPCLILNVRLMILKGKRLKSTAKKKARKPTQKYMTLWKRERMGFGRWNKRENG
jgi:hypothetical protein